jgi:4-amino-4-deoxy-L-arabinose transferase-like glycosyltransferase
MTPRFWSLLYLAALVAYIIAGAWLVPFHGDESTQIYMSRDYAYTFLQRDLSRVFFSLNPTSPQEQDLRIINGTVNKYTMGLAWHLVGFDVADVNEQWDWGAPYAYNVETGHHPGADLLRVARLPSALFTAAGAVVVFLIGTQLGGRPTAVAASFLYATNPIILVNGRRAMMEGSLLFGEVLVVLAGILFAQSAYRWRYALLLGGAMGFALASKHTNVFTVMLVFALCLGYIIVTDWRRILRLIGAGALAAAVFLALNPAWWRAPLATAAEIIRLRSNLLAVQTDVFGSYPDFAAQVAGFWRQVIVGRPMYYEVAGWGAHIGAQIGQYEASFLGGLRLPAFVMLTLLVAGVAALFRRRENRPARVMVGTWAAGVAVLTLLLTPLEWQRYYLPAVPGLCIVAGYGAASLFELAKRRERTPEHTQPTP